MINPRHLRRGVSRRRHVVGVSDHPWGRRPGLGKWSTFGNPPVGPFCAVGAAKLAPWQKYLANAISHTDADICWTISAVNWQHACCHGGIRRLARLGMGTQNNLLSACGPNIIPSRPDVCPYQRFSLPRVGSPATPGADSAAEFAWPGSPHLVAWIIPFHGIRNLVSGL